MNSEIEDLKLEIKVLKERINILEGIERRRKIFKYIKIVAIIIIVGIIAWYLYSFYQKIIDIYNNNFFLHFNK